jgi:hypothetical protein
MKKQKINKDDLIVQLDYIEIEEQKKFRKEFEPKIQLEEIHI